MNETSLGESSITDGKTPLRNATKETLNSSFASSVGEKAISSFHGHDTVNLTLLLLGQEESRTPGDYTRAESRCEKTKLHEVRQAPPRAQERKRFSLRVRISRG